MQPHVDHAWVWATFAAVCAMLACLLEPLHSMGLRACLSLAVSLLRCLVWWALRLLPWVLLLVLVVVVLVVGVLGWRICTYKPQPGLALHHDVIPSNDFDQKQWTIAYSSSVVDQLPQHPRLRELPPAGSLVAWPVQDTVMDALQGVGPLAQLRQQGLEQEPALARAAQAPLEDLLSQPDVCRCMTLGPPQVPIVLVGTAHVSQASADYTREAILALEPDLVVVELCEARVPLLLADASDPGPRPSLVESLKAALSGGGQGTGLLQALLSSFLQGAADQMGTQPGAEFVAARRAVVELAAAKQQPSIYMAKEASAPQPQHQQQRHPSHNSHQQQQQQQQQDREGELPGSRTSAGVQEGSTEAASASAGGQQQGQQGVAEAGPDGMPEEGCEQGYEEEAEEHMLQLWGLPLSMFPPEPPSSSEQPEQTAGGEALPSTGDTLQPQHSSQEGHPQQPQQQGEQVQEVASSRAAPGEATDAADVFADAASDAPSSSSGPEEHMEPGQLPGVTLALADRPLADTLAATWGALTPWRRVKFVGSMLRAVMSGKLDEELLKDLLEDDDMVTHLLKELSLEYPEVLLPLVHDRNWYLAVRIWRYARLTRRPLVAVLGKAHLQGVVHALLYLSIVALRMVEQQQAELQPEEQAGSEVADADAQAGQC